jgi:Helix-turn-helix domain
MGDDRALAKEKAASLLGLSPNTLADRRWRARVGLHAVRVGGRLRFEEKEILKLLERSRESHSEGAECMSDIQLSGYPGPDPDFDVMSADELRTFITETDDKIVFGRDHEAEELFVIGLVDQRHRAEAVLACRNGQSNLTSDYRNPLSEVKFEREVNAAALQAEAIAQGIPPVTFKPFLGRDGYVVKGWSHLVAAYPKTGKTELMVRALADWPTDKLLYVTEEPKSVWQARLLKLALKV